MHVSLLYMPHMPHHQQMNEATYVVPWEKLSNSPFAKSGYIWSQTNWWTHTYIYTNNNRITWSFDWAGTITDVPTEKGTAQQPRQLSNRNKIMPVLVAVPLLEWKTPSTLLCTMEITLARTITSAWSRHPSSSLLIWIFKTGKWLKQQQMFKSLRQTWTCQLY